MLRTQSLLLNSLEQSTPGIRMEFWKALDEISELKTSTPRFACLLQ
jgi:hypothetical protein